MLNISLFYYANLYAFLRNSCSREIFVVQGRRYNYNQVPQSKIFSIACMQFFGPWHTHHDHKHVYGLIKFTRFSDYIKRVTRNCSVFFPLNIILYACRPRRWDNNIDVIEQKKWEKKYPEDVRIIIRKGKWRRCRW